MVPETWLAPVSATAASAVTDDPKDRLPDCKVITEICDEAIKWLDSIQLAEVEEFNAQQKEVDGVYNPIITKLYADLSPATSPHLWPGRWLQRCTGTWGGWTRWSTRMRSSRQITRNRRRRYLP